MTLSLLVLITRTDGVQMGFTNCDVDIVFSGVTYQAADGLGASSVETASGTGIDNADLMGLIKSARITEADIFAGKFDAAQVLVQLVNRNDLTQGSLVVVKGYLGEIHQIDQAFKAEVRSLSQLLKTSIGNVTTKQCTCERLGNAKCKLTMTGNALNGSPIRASKTVASASGLTVTFGSDAAPTGHYSNGLLKFTSGANSGVTREIKSHTNSSGSAVLNLRTAFPFDISPGDVATLEAGCDRLFATCDTKFGNANNFHGVPFLPGNDKIVRAGRGAG